MLFCACFGDEMFWCNSLGWCYLDSGWTENGQTRTEEGSSSDHGHVAPVRSVWLRGGGGLIGRRYILISFVRFLLKFDFFLLEGVCVGGGGTDILIFLFPPLSPSLPSPFLSCSTSSPSLLFVFVFLCGFAHTMSSFFIFVCAHCAHTYIYMGVWIYRCTDIHGVVCVRISVCVCV